ncbi:MAG: hypothetical protein Q9193_001818 [Seirophora villosa]
MSITEHPGKLKVLPDSSHTRKKNLSAYQDANTQKNATVSYAEAAAACRQKVNRISQDCRQANQKFVDKTFDIESDLMMWRYSQRVEDCLIPLGHCRQRDFDEVALRPFSVKRVDQIFDNPRFFTEEMTANAVHQGANGDCWLMAAIVALSHNKGLLDKICVAMDEKVGVYGFVFFRDGEWIHEIIDDKLYLAKQDFHESLTEQGNWASATDLEDPDERYRKAMQTGSIALSFARCRNDNETWLPLLEKAYAKAHGDYGSIDGGWVGEALEDLTGGVTSELFTADIFDRDEFWSKQLMNVNKEFLFGATQMGGRHGERKGIVEKHTYSIIQATELKEGLETFRLLKISCANVPWADRYLEDTWFRLRVTKAERVIIALCQASKIPPTQMILDDRYFRGLKGLYDFQLQFCIQQDGNAEFNKLNKTAYFMSRSVTTELDLEAGEYSIILKITATRGRFRTKPEKVVIQSFLSRPEKLRSVGERYDTAHAKGGFEQLEKEYKDRVQAERRAERRQKRKLEAKKAFEVRRWAGKQEKLKRLRAGRPGAESDEESDALVIRIERGKGKGRSKTTNRQASNDRECAHGKPTASSNQMRVIIERSQARSEKVKPENQLSTTTAKKTDVAPKQAQDESTARNSTSSKPREGNTTESDNKSSSSNEEARKQRLCAFLGVQLPSRSAVTSVRNTSGRPNAVSDQVTNTIETDPNPPVTTREEGTATHTPAGTARNLTLDDISDDGLSWSSDVDAPPDSGGSSESGSDTDYAPIRELLRPKRTAGDDSEPKDGGKVVEEEGDTWDPVCVFGLRVYSQGSQVEVDVVKKVL